MRIRIALPILLVVAACQVSSGAAPSTTELPAGPETTAVSSTTSSSASTVPSTSSPPPPSTTATTTASTTSRTSTTTTTLFPGVTEAPSWLGSRPLPQEEAGEPKSAPTPPELVDRRFVSPDHLPPPDDDAFRATVTAVPPDVAARSTWSAECPVDLDDLAYLTVTFHGFDGRAHTGELVVAESVADDVVTAFRLLYEARYPIEEMRVTSARDLEAEPTGDGNITSSFVCRPVTGGSRWSEHAYGLAIDINPFHNPYVRGETVLPELAGAYVDRDRQLPGMIHEGHAVTDAFDSIGWGWGGRWSSLEDYQHFSLRGR